VAAPVNFYFVTADAVLALTVGSASKMAIDLSFSPFHARNSSGLPRNFNSGASLNN
jgi:hypothetical protein